MDVGPALTQTLRFEPLGTDDSLIKLLGLEPPPFRTDRSAFLQLQYLDDYIRRPDLSAASSTRSIAIESHYIDRDFIVDHSVLFSRNLQPPANHCRRVHFFAAESSFVEQELARIAGILCGAGSTTHDEYREACRDFSKRCYLGFTVIRPLPACRVGRTVLRRLPLTNDEDASQRIMTCTRDYGVHFAGVDLKVSGLAFQQQDLGVSRCATVALWCALHKVGERETIATLTPADITNLASRHRLPFGRSMPSEGLAVDQLCLAIESVGVSPYLAMVPSVERGRSLIYSATLSHMPCILIMQKVGAERDWHAVTVAGIKLASVHAPCYVGGSKVAGDDLSGDMKALYVHDDRVGPYCRVDINGTDPNALHLSINTQGHVKGAIPEDWVIRNVLIPTHSKIRVSFNDLRTICVDWLIAEIQSVIANEQCKSPGDLDAVQFKYWIERGHEYSRRVLTEQLLTKEKGISLCKTYVMPRYVGVIRFISSAFGQIDVLMDTTSPRPNYNWIGVVARHTDDESGRLRHIVGEYLAECCQCQDQYFS